MFKSLGLVIAVVSSAAAAPCPSADFTKQSTPTIVNGALAYCDVTAKSCWVLDVDKNTWSSQAYVPDAAVTVTATEVTACAAGGKDCLAIPTTAYADGGSGTANDDRTLVAVYAGHHVDIYDTATKKRLVQLSGWKTPMGPAKEAMFQGAKFTGKTLVVWESESPVSESGRLYNPRTGKKIADLVKAGTEVEPWAVQIDGDVWAFAGFSPKLFLVNVATGKVTRTHALAGPPSGRVLAGKLRDGRIVMDSDGVVFLDPATGKSTPLPAPTCAK